MNNPPIALSIAGYDPSAGAGVLADSGVFQSLGVFGLAATTAIVAQRPGHVAKIDWLDPEIFKAQLDELSIYPITAIKIGMLATESTLLEVCQFLDQHSNLPVVLDPVLKASAGDSLSESNFIQALKKELLPRITILTPNRNEAEVLLDRTINDATKEIKTACVELSKTNQCSVLLKGGHFESTEFSVDYWCSDGTPNSLQEFTSPKLDIPDLHGTGCHLSSAICAHLALGYDLEDAIAKAKKHLHQAMAEHYQWQSKNGASIEALGTK